MHRTKKETQKAKGCHFLAHPVLGRGYTSNKNICKNVLKHF